MDLQKRKIHEIHYNIATNRTFQFFTPVVEFYSSSGWAIHIRWSKCCQSLCVSLHVHQGEWHKS